MNRNQEWFAYFLCPNCKRLVKYWHESFTGTCSYINRVNTDLDPIETFGYEIVDSEFYESYCPLCKCIFQKESEYFLIEISRNLEIRFYDPTWNYWTANKNRRKLFESLRNNIIDQHLKILEKEKED